MQSVADLDKAVKEADCVVIVPIIVYMIIKILQDAKLIFDARNAIGRWEDNPRVVNYNGRLFRNRAAGFIASKVCEFLLAMETQSWDRQLDRFMTAFKGLAAQRLQAISAVYLSP